MRACSWHRVRQAQETIAVNAARQGKATPLETPGWEGWFQAYDEEHDAWYYFNPDTEERQWAAAAAATTTAAATNTASTTTTAEAAASSTTAVPTTDAVYCCIETNRY